MRSFRLESIEQKESELDATRQQVEDDRENTERDRKDRGQFFEFLIDAASFGFAKESLGATGD